MSPSASKRSTPAPSPRENINCHHTLRSRACSQSQTNWRNPGCCVNHQRINALTAAQSVRRTHTDAYRADRLEALKQIAARYGGACLSTLYLKSTAKLRWHCARGHEWEAIPGNIARGHWCMICGNERQGRAKAHSIEMMHEIAASRGGRCLSPSYRNNRTKLRWRCAHGHEWEAVPESIVSSGKRKGSWCPICVGKLPRKLACQKLKDLASARGGELLSRCYHDARTPLRWRCAKGHEWEAVPDAVKHGTWCPVCGGSYPLSLAMMRECAGKYAGACLSTNYVNSKTHLRWKCAEGHEWTSKPDHVLRGHWCPICSAGVSERICRALLERMTGVCFPKARPPWLRSKRGGQMEFDGYAPSLGLAFEYHGEQHYARSPFFHRGPRAFKQRQQDDEQKRRLCRRRKVTLLEVPYWIPHHQVQVYLGSLLDYANLGVICDRTPIKISELNIWRRKDCNDMRALAVSRGGRLVSDYYISNSEKLRWRCTEGHEWEAVPSSVRRGAWCPICGDKRAAIKRAYTIEKMRTLAEAKGGVCLSANYSNVKSRLRWRCAEGHEWESQASVIIGGHWCPKCEQFRLGRKYALSLEEIQKTAKGRGGECLADNYLNTREKLIWRCAKGHLWRANTNSIRRGSWCPICAKTFRTNRRRCYGR